MSELAEAIPDLREVSMPAAKITPLVAAWTATGSAADRQKSILHKAWPRLFNAIKLLVEGQSEDWAEFEANRAIVAINTIRGEVLDDVQAIIDGNALTLPEVVDELKALIKKYRIGDNHD